MTETVLLAVIEVQIAFPSYLGLPFWEGSVPRYTSGGSSRVLTAYERQLLVENTDCLIERFGPSFHYGPNLDIPTAPVKSHFSLTRTSGSK
jgi:hypothetical protein